MEDQVLWLIVAGGLRYLFRDREEPTAGRLWGIACGGAVLVALLYAGG
jgi:hypothetical protein